jgi:dTDP-4-dehydrorhamnose reductase
MNVFIIGCNGQLGQDMTICAQLRGHSATGVDYPVIDITSAQSTRDAIIGARPDVVINCAAHTAVDLCETESAKAFAINADGVRNIGSACSDVNAKLVHISTDYVFDGTKTTPYIESDPTNPQSVYGKSKLAGEQACLASCKQHFIFRIAWLYGTRGNNFLKAIRTRAQKLAETGETLNVVSDQIGTPTYTAHVCQQIEKMMTTDHYGLYHCTNEGVCSWFDFAKAIIDAYKIPVQILPCTTKEFPRPAPRPAYSVLENQHLKQLGLNIMPKWEVGLREYIEEEKNIRSPLKIRFNA